MNRKILRQWFSDKGDKTHRLDYNLNQDSIVIDVGGYYGKWSEQIYQKYQPNIYLFEPVEKFFESCRIKFEKNDKVRVYNFGLSSKIKNCKINVDFDSSSIYKVVDNSETEEIKLLDIFSVLDELDICEIDLMKVNIEGGEYDLLEHIVSKNKQIMFKNIQVQFHDFMKDAGVRRSNIHKQLEKTHYLTYNYDFIWENWKRK